MLRATSVLLLLLCVGLAGCADDKVAPPSEVDASQCALAPEIPIGKHPVAHLTTRYGTMKIDLHAEYAPKTVANFVCLAEAGFYDGIKFHRVISEFMMQGGDPLTKDDDPANDGTGGPGYTIPEEFHHQLRHDNAGILSMANAGRTTGGSQFFITFGPAEWLNDRHTIFGQARDLEIIHIVNADIASRDGVPKEELVIKKMAIFYEELDPTINGPLQMWSPDDAHPVPMDGGQTRYLAVVHNTATRRVDVQLTANGATIEDGFEQFELAANQRATFVVTADIPAEGPAQHNITVTASNGESETTLHLYAIRQDIGPRTVALRDPVEADYIGMTPDGRFFDTSVERVARFADDHELWFDVASFRGEGAYAPFEFTPGAGVIEGFTALSLDVVEGGVNAGRIAPEQAYRYGGCSGQRTCLAGVTLLFQMHIREIHDV